MTNDGQSETIGFLGSPHAFGPGEETPRTIRTHISVVMLIGRRALKLKRAVHLSYLDLSTPERRLAMCRHELELNRRTAPDLYRAVHRITRERDGTLALDGQGELVDAVLEMRRFDDALLFDRLAQEGRLNATHMGMLAEGIARFHRAAEISSDRQGAQRLARVLAVNERAFAAADILPRAEVEALNAACRAALERHGALLDARACDGKVRRGHGDLHLRNICLDAGEPLLFDCLEFDEDLATADILYDLAFVLMDLWHRGLEALANTLFNRYLDATGDETGLRLLPLFMAVRAAVRAHVTAIDSGKPPAARLAEAQAYLRLGSGLLQEKPAILVAIGGYSGSGKSTLAAMVAPKIGPAPGARIAASDRIRKKLHGVAPETRLPAEAYAEAVSARTYGEMVAQAGNAVAQGHAAIADAVFDRQVERERVEDAARRLGVKFHGIWLDVPATLLVERVVARRNDPSDATPDVVRAQIARHGAPDDWTRLAAQTDTASVARAALDAICSGAGPMPASDRC